MYSMFKRMWTFIKWNSLKTFQYNFIHILRMVRQNLTYLNKLSVSLLLLIFVYVIYNNKMEISVNTYWIWSKSLGIKSRAWPTWSDFQVHVTLKMTFHFTFKCSRNFTLNFNNYHSISIWFDFSKIYFTFISISKVEMLRNLNHSYLTFWFENEIFPLKMKYDRIISQFMERIFHFETIIQEIYHIKDESLFALWWIPN